MSDAKIERYLRKIRRLRQQLSDLEARRQQAQADDSAGVWEDFQHISSELAEVEERLTRINRYTLTEINQLRETIVERLADYQTWREKMRQMEALFVIHILRPGYIYKQALRQRKYLEKQYERLRHALTLGEYASAEELEADVRQALEHSRTAFKPDQESFQDEVLRKEEQEAARTLAGQFDVTEIEEAVDLEALESEFRRVVLFATHPDTSDTPPEVFLTVKEVYEQQDALLMSAYVAQYRGEIALEEADPLAGQERLSRFQAAYHRLAERLARRLKKLLEELTPQELKDPEKLRQTYVQRREELLALIQEETQQIQQLHEKIGSLPQDFERRQKGPEDG